MKKLFAILLFSIFSFLAVQSLAQQEKQWIIPKGTTLEVIKSTGNHVSVKLPESNVTYYAEKEVFKEIKEELTKNDVEIFAKDGKIVEITRESTLPVIFLDKDTKLEIINSANNAGIMSLTIKTLKGNEFIVQKHVLSNVLLQLRKTKVAITLDNNWIVGYSPVG